MVWEQYGEMEQSVAESGQQVLAGNSVTPAVADYTAVLQTQLARHYPDWEVTDLTVAGQGVTFLAFQAETRPFGLVALRVPWQRIIVSENDGTLESRRLLQQDADLTTHLQQHALPVPAVHWLHLGTDGYDFMAAAFMPNDSSLPDQRTFGRLVRQIHQLPIPAVPLVGMGGFPCYQLIAQRISERMAGLTRQTGLEIPLPAAGTMMAALAPRAEQRALLHMDARPANLFTQQGQILAIADWENALIGDPALELARIAEYGFLDDLFIAGYGADLLAALPPAIATIYRLDTAVMLANVFVQEAPDPTAAQTMIARTRALVAQLRDLLA